MTVERSGKTYCSERCAALDAAGKRDEHCTCGHPSCGPAAA
ncbi:MAG TPA: hypothetical protein VKF32_14440 [Thermoanaerobaculia bacterium]|nr:hypothetical protein [Thermoanaerobaculia bacterium]